MSEKQKTRIRKTYTLGFKQELVDLYDTGTPASAICNKYQITPSLLYKWIDKLSSRKSQEVKSNLTKEQQEILELKKEIKNLNKKIRDYEDTVYILKQAAAILAQKDK